MKEHWNTHYIGGLRHDTIKGRPDSLYYLPEAHGGATHLLLPVPESEREFGKLHVTEREEHNDYLDVVGEKH